MSEEERLKKLRDQEVKKYLKEIKKREQDLILKAREGEEAYKAK